MVGTPMKIVISCSFMMLRAASPVNFGTSTMVAPVRNATFIAQVCPKVWNSGRQPRTRSSAVRSKVFSSSTFTCSTSARWQPSAPFGCPVVPLV